MTCLLLLLKVFALGHMKSVLELSINSHSIQRFLKHSSNAECAENVQSSHVVECKCELRHIPGLHPKLVHNQFSGICTAHPCAQHTDKDTQTMLRVMTIAIDCIDAESARDINKTYKVKRNNFSKTTTDLLYWAKPFYKNQIIQTIQTTWQWHQLEDMQIICKSLQTNTPVPHHSVLTGQMPFLPPNQQRQSTEGSVYWHNDSKMYVRFLVKFD